MKILIDFTQIPLQKAGAGVYAYWLIKELDKNNENIYILVNDDEECFNDLRNISIIKISSVFRNFFFRIILEQVYIPFLAVRHRFDKVHSLHYSFPLLISKKSVVTIHDMTFFLYPNVHVFFKRIYFKLFIKLASRFAAQLITVSKSTKDDLIKIFPKANNHVTVIPLGHNINRFELRKSEKYSWLDKKQFILFIGTLEPRKNITSIIKSFANVKSAYNDLKLVICGKKGWYYDEIFLLCEKLELENDIVFTGYVSEEEKHYLLGKAKLFLYPSIYEGFGIPVLEALAFGLPTITSNISSLPEVAGDAAILVDPKNTNEIQTAILRIMNDENEAEKLHHKALERSELFSWSNMAEKTNQIYGAK